MTSKDTASAAGRKEAEWERRRRLDAVFGDDLPEQILEPGESSGGGRGRSWYDENRPPHHG